MATNIAKLQAQLQRVPDQALIGYVQNPDGQVPSYLALAELQRRKEIRQASAPKQAMPTQTVAQQVVAESEPGVAGLPVPDQMFQEKSMAAGGIVAFGPGGSVDTDGYIITDSYPGSPYDQSVFGWAPRAGGAFASDVLGLPSRFNWMRDPKTGKLVRRYESEGWTPRISGFEQSEADRIASGNKRTQEIVSQANAEKAANSPVTQKVNKEIIAKSLDPMSDYVSAPYLPGQDQRQFPTVKDNVPPKSPAEQVTRDRAFKPTPFEAPTVTYTPVTFDQKAFDAMKEEVPTAQAERDRFKELIGENKGLAALQDRLGKMETKAAAEEERAPWMALAKAGFAMAGGKSRHAFSNIAEGAQAGLADYAASKDKLAAAEEKRFALQSQLAQAERAEQLAAAKFGEDSMQHIKAQNRATDLAALTAKTQIETTNASNELKAKADTAKNAVDVAQLRVTEKHYNDWYNVSLKTAEKSLQGIEKQGIQQQTQILNNLLDEANNQIKNLKDDMNATPQDRINAQAKYDAIQKRLFEVGGVQYTPKATAPASKLTPAGKGSGADFRFGF